MSYIANTLIGLVALLHIYFMVLEMFFWAKPYGQRVFKQSHAKAKETASLAKNQGLYNGFLAAGLFWSLLNPDPVTAFQTKIFFLTCIMVAGVYGALTVNKKILLAQATPAGVALMLLFLS